MGDQMPRDCMKVKLHGETKFYKPDVTKAERYIRKSDLQEEEPDDFTFDPCKHGSSQCKCESNLMMNASTIFYFMHITDTKNYVKKDPKKILRDESLETLEEV